MLGAFVWALDARPLVSLDVTKDRGLFRENSQGQIENIYRLKIINKTQQARRYGLSLADAGPFSLQGAHEIRLEPGEIIDLPVSVALAGQGKVSSSESLRFAVNDLDDPSISASTRSTFVSPINRCRTRPPVHRRRMISPTPEPVPNEAL